jgi:hypothetical protein
VLPTPLPPRHIKTPPTPPPYDRDVFERPHTFLARDSLLQSSHCQVTRKQKIITWITYFAF